MFVFIFVVIVCSNSPSPPQCTHIHTHTSLDFNCKRNLHAIFPMLVVGAKKNIVRQGSGDARTNEGPPPTCRTDYCPLPGWFSHSFSRQHISRRANLILSTLLRTILKVKVLLAQSCPILCNPMNCSPPGSSLHGILQARILGWITIPLSR